MTAVLIGLTACQEKTQAPEASSLNATSETSLSEINGDGQVAILNVESNSYWEVSAHEGELPAEWINFDTKSGSGDGIITATFAKNPSNKVSRSAVIKVALLDGSLSVDLNVMQNKASYASGIQPIVNYIKYNNAEETKPVNGSLSEDGKVFTFTSGAAIKANGIKFSSVGWVGSEYYRSILLATGWDAEKPSVIYEIPTTQKLEGTFTMAFGIAAANSSNCFVPRDFWMSWSSDGSSWSKMDEVYAWDGTDNQSGENRVCKDYSFQVLPNINKAAFAHRQAVFTISAEKAIPAGGKLYVKLEPASTATIKGEAINPEHGLRIYYGSVIYQWEKKSYHYNAELGNGDNVILAEGFDEMMSGIDIFAGTEHLAYVSGKVYIPSEGWDATNATEGFGYVRFATGGSYITTPALSKLGDTPADITLTFDACPYLSPKLALDANVLTVEIAEGDGAVEAQPECETLFVTPEDGQQMKPISVKITGATSKTKIKIAGTHRWFIDNILITK